MAFDLDHTLLDGSSDMMIQAACNVKPACERLTVTTKERGVVRFRHRKDRFHYPKRLQERDFRALLNRISLSPGIPECVVALKRLGGELICISDANDFYITHVLERHSLSWCFDGVYANFASFDPRDGRLVISPYMTNLRCELSSKNMCKGKALMDHLRKRGYEGRSFEFVGYAGDGYNDFCPMYRLGPGDLAFPRQGYSVCEMIAMQTNDDVFLQAKIVFWKNALEIVDAVRKKMDKMGRLTEDGGCLGGGGAGGGGGQQPVAAARWCCEGVRPSSLVGGSPDVVVNR